MKIVRRILLSVAAKVRSYQEKAGSRELRRQVRRLNHPDALRRVRIARSLLARGVVKEQAAQALLDVMGNISLESAVRREAAQIPFRLLPPTHFDPLIDLLEDQEVGKSIAEDLAYIVQRKDIDYIPYLRRALRGSERVLGGVLKVVQLAGYRAKALESDLGAMLPSDDDIIGLSIVETLAAMGGCTSSCDAVSGCLSEWQKNQYYAGEIRKLLLCFRRSAGRPIGQAMEQIVTSKGAELQPRVLDPFFSLLNDLGTWAHEASGTMLRFLSHDTEEIRLKAVSALGCIFPELRSLADDIASETDERKRRKSFEAFKGVASFCDQVLALKSEDGQIVQAAKDELSTMGRTVVPLLLQVLEDRYQYECRDNSIKGHILFVSALCEAITRVFQCPEAVPLLTQILNNYSTQISQADVVRALSSIGPAAAPAKPAIDGWLGYLLSAQPHRKDAILEARKALLAIEGITR